MSSKVGDKFNIDEYLEAREIGIKVTREVASLMEVGMSEDDGKDLIQKVSKKYRVERFWHPPKFRIGPNTLKSFKEKSEKNIFLQKEDIFFIDIGPIYKGHEGDYGETFVQGGEQIFFDIKKKCELVFQKTAKFCLEGHVRGAELYHFAKKCAQENNCELNLKMQGHRLGDFPHAVHYKKSLGGTEELIEIPHLWVLEILVREPNKNFGAFFEDILFKKPLLDKDYLN